MPHVLIAGMTESGKTRVAKKICSDYRRRGIKTIVLDPLHDNWQADLQTTDAAEFLDVVRRSRSCGVFIDESGEMIGRYNDEMFWLATRARHFGHNCHFIVQRPAQLSKTVRDQTKKLFLFNVSLDDAKIMANDWNKPALREAHTLRQFEFYYCGRFDPPRKMMLAP